MAEVRLVSDQWQVGGLHEKYEGRRSLLRHHQDDRHGRNRGLKEHWKLAIHQQKEKKQEQGHSTIFQAVSNSVFPKWLYNPYARKSCSSGDGNRTQGLRLQHQSQPTDHHGIMA